jgi:predicted DNA-binding transcriptional regulator AlpA
MASTNVSDETEVIKLPAEGFVRVPTITAVLGIGRSTWWAGVKDGRFPRPVRLGPRMTAWRVADVRKVLATIAGPWEPQPVQRKLAQRQKTRRTRSR